MAIIPGPKGAGPVRRVPRGELAAWLGSWLAGVGPGDVVVLSGAGVSRDPPASLPLGGDLLARVFEGCFEAGVLDTILDYHQQLGLVTTSPCDGEVVTRPPRLETVLGVAVDVHGLASTMAVLDDLRHAPFNALHAVLAAHLAVGGRQLTANFDGCIERAAAALGTSDGDLWHFHGSLARDPTGASLGATLRAIESGFPDGDAARFGTALQAGRRLVVLGYSGSDFFDVDPAIAELAPGELRRLGVLWVAHQATGLVHRPVDAADPQLLRLLARAGAEVTVLCADTAAVGATLAAIWGLAPPSPAVDAPTSPRPEPTVGGSAPVDPDRPQRPERPDPDRRARATFRLCRQLRLHNEVDRLLSDPGLQLSPIERFRARVDVLWDQGRYATARRLWRRAPAEVAAWERTERIGACLWEQGRLVPAYLWLTYHLRRLEPGSPARLRSAETAARVVLRMLRGPDTRWLGRRLGPGLRAELEAVDRGHGIDMYLRAQDVAQQLATGAGTHPAATAEDARTSSEWFLEAGDLAALLAYRHSWYRRSYDPTTPIDVLARRYRRHQADKDLVGSAGARAMLLPGAERVYSTRELVTDLLGPTQFAPWHRTRLLAAFLTRKVLLHTRRRRRPAAP